MSICYFPATGTKTLSPRFTLPRLRFNSESKEDTWKDNAETEKDVFESEVVAPLSTSLHNTSVRETRIPAEEQNDVPPLHLPRTPDSVRLFSSGLCADTDSTYDSGAVPQHSTPEPVLTLPAGDPLQSPPLVISVNKNTSLLLGDRGEGDTAEDAMEEKDHTDGMIADSCIAYNDIDEGKIAKNDRESRAVAASRLFIRDLQSQSLPILRTVRSESCSRLEYEGKSRVTMPHMGTSRLLSPQKPPRLNPPFRSLERNKISTVKLNSLTAPNSPILSSTPKHHSITNQSPVMRDVKLERSFTAVSSKEGAFYVRTSNPFRDDILRMNPLTKEQLKRGGSCSSEASSGVSSGCTDSSCIGSQEVTVNGHHHCYCNSCDDTLSTCQHCDTTI